MATSPSGSDNLTWYEFLGCVEVAQMRFGISSQNGLKHNNTQERDWLTRMSQEIMGVCAERLVAKTLKIYWDGSVNTFHSVPDVADVEVRSTIFLDGHLILRDNDSINRRYVLVVGRPPEQWIAGIVEGKYCLVDRYFYNFPDQRPAWFVPQGVLESWP